MACFEAQTLDAAEYEDVDKNANRVFESFMNDIILGVAFLEHYECRAEVALETLQNVNVDVLGQSFNKPSEVYCDCPECGNKMAASRFAPHLAKCLRKGRTSSRVTTQRVDMEENVEVIDIDNSEVEEIYSDEDWLPKASKRQKKSDAKKRRSKADIKSACVVTRESARHAYEGMTHASRETLLQQICGVVSSQTGRYCMRSMKCPHHSNEERSIVRNFVLDDLDQIEGCSTLGDIKVETSAVEISTLLPGLE